MPIIDGKSVSPDHAIHQGLCPECAAKLDYKTALPHAQGHWGMDPNRSHLSEEGRRRFNLILDFIEIAKPKPRLEGEGKSRHQRVFMGEPSPSDERKWWALQNRLGNVWSQIALAPIAVSLFEFAEGRYWFGAGYLLLGLVLAFVVNNLMKSEEIKPAADASAHSYRYIGVVAVTLTWALCVFTIYAQLFLSPEARPNQVIGYVSDYSGRVVSGTPFAAATPRIESAFPQGASPASPLEGVRPFSAGNIQTLQLWMLDLPRPCRVKITAPPENQPLRLWLRDTAINGVGNIGGRSDKVSPCTVVDDDRDMHPDWYGGQTFPEAGFIVHVTPSWSAVGEFLEAGLRQIQLKARHGQRLPSDSPYDLYLELGKGSPWQ